MKTNKIRFWIIFLLLIGPGLYWSIGELSAGEVTAEDKILFTASTVAILADWQTTRYMSKHYDTCQCYETNSWLGKYPTKQDVDKWAALRLAQHIGVNYLIQRFGGKYKRSLMWAENLTVVYIHGYKGAYNNHKHGLKLDFTTRF
jgi:hypothetical protein